jgi:hypothetical protein
VKSKQSLKRVYKNTGDLFKKINLVLSDYLVQIYDYNNIAKQKGYYLKPVHIVVKKKDSEKIKYYYYGRYWYKIEYKKGKGSRIKWIYMGKEKPDPSLPDPPKNPLEGLVVRVSEDTITINAPSEEVFRLIFGEQATSQSQ